MIFTWLLLLIPISLGIHYLTDAGPIWVFVSAILTIVPLAEWIRRATENLAAQVGPAIGGLLNVTFGNTAELILALFVLAAANKASSKARSRVRSSATACSVSGLR